MTTKPFLSQCLLVIGLASGLPISTSEEESEELCKIVYKVDDKSSVSAVAVHNVLDAERCCAECRGLPACNAWTWGVSAGDTHPTSCDIDSDGWLPAVAENILTLVPSDAFELKDGVDCKFNESAHPNAQSAVDPQVCKTQCIQDHRDCSAVVFWNGDCFFRTNSDCAQNLVQSPGRTMYLRVRKDPVLALLRESQETSSSTITTTTTLIISTTMKHSTSHKSNGKNASGSLEDRLMDDVGGGDASGSLDGHEPKQKKSDGVVVVDHHDEEDVAFAQPYKQCGGEFWRGLTQCSEGFVCQPKNQYYAQCKPSFAATPGATIFCWSLLTPGTYEPMVLTKQWELNMGIFACDGHTIVSNVSSDVLFPNGPLASKVRVSRIHAWLWASVAHGPHGTAHVLNTPVFIKAWHLICSEGVYKKFDWTMKLDVDALIVVPRMRSLLVSHDARQTVVLWNTEHDAVGNYLHGPVEALSKSAVAAYERGSQYCIDHVDYAKEGEDYYLGICMKELKVQGVYEPWLLKDAYMMGKRYVNCNTQHAVFHPLKSPEELQSCANVVDQSSSFSIRRFSSTHIEVPSNVVQFGARHLAALVMVSLCVGALTVARLQAGRTFTDPQTRTFSRLMLEPGGDSPVASTLQFVI